MFMYVRRLLKHALPTGHEPVPGRKSARGSGTPEVPFAQTILRPGQTLMLGARPLGLAGTAAAPAARSAFGSV
jgi:hypothetical protein